MSWPCWDLSHKYHERGSFQARPATATTYAGADGQVISPQNILLAFGNPRNQGASYFYCSRWLSERDINFRAVDLLRAFAALASEKDKHQHQHQQGEACETRMTRWPSEADLTWRYLLLRLASSYMSTNSKLLHSAAKSWRRVSAKLNSESRNTTVWW
jgi:hypothetical protein